MPESQVRPRGRLRFAPSLRLEESLSLAAFVMSLGITLINVYYAMRGSEIAVDPPAQLILYRDGDGDASVLTATVRIDMINVSDGYGDVLKSARLSLDSDATRFEYQGTVKAVFANTANPPPCELGKRCITLPGLYLVERSDEILDMPSGSARAFQLSFPLVSWNCDGSAQGCGPFETFPKSVQSLPSKGLVATVDLKFHSDGRRTLRCAANAINLDYLRKVGWVSLPCTRAQSA